MSSRERIRAIVAGGPADRCGLWLGNPHRESWPALHRYFGTRDEEALRRKLHDDVRWICPQLFPGIYRHPDGRGMFDWETGKKRHGQPGPLSDCEDAKAVETLVHWPNPDYGMPVKLRQRTCSRLPPRTTSIVSAQHEEDTTS